MADTQEPLPSFPVICCRAAVPLTLHAFAPNGLEANHTFLSACTVSRCCHTCSAPSAASVGAGVKGFMVCLILTPPVMCLQVGSHAAHLQWATQLQLLGHDEA